MGAPWCAGLVVERLPLQLSGSLPRKKSVGTLVGTHDGFNANAAGTEFAGAQELLDREHHLPDVAPILRWWVVLALIVASMIGVPPSPSRPEGGGDTFILSDPFFKRIR